MMFTADFPLSSSTHAAGVSWNCFGFFLVSLTGFNRFSFSENVIFLSCGLNMEVNHI